MDIGTKSIKEETDMILEPLQIMIQLALLSHCPIGTKLSVSNNLLYLQRPTMIQGIMRWYNQDTKDDLYYLYHGIRRYYQWYKDITGPFFDYLLNLAVKGIDRLTKTYEKSDKKTIIHTLSLYKNLLKMDTPDLFNNKNEEIVSIDNVFQNITKLYDEKIIIVVFNILKLLDTIDDVDSKNKYIESLLYFLDPTNVSIHKWIHENLTV